MLDELGIGQTRATIAPSIIGFRPCDERLGLVELARRITELAESRCGHGDCPCGHNGSRPLTSRWTKSATAGPWGRTNEIIAEFADEVTLDRGRIMLRPDCAGGMGRRARRLPRKTPPRSESSV
jgi:hypothetical protein